MRTKMKNLCLYQERKRRRVPWEHHCIQSVQKGFFKVPILSFKTSCEHVLYLYIKCERMAV